MMFLKTMHVRGAQNTFLILILPATRVAYWSIKSETGGKLAASERVEKTAQRCLMRVSDAGVRDNQIYGPASQQSKGLDGFKSSNFFRTVQKLEAGTNKSRLLCKAQMLSRHLVMMTTALAPHLIRTRR